MCVLFEAQPKTGKRSAVRRRQICKHPLYARCSQKACAHGPSPLAPSAAGGIRRGRPCPRALPREGRSLLVPPHPHGVRLEARRGETGRVCPQNRPHTFEVSVSMSPPARVSLRACVCGNGGKNRIPFIKQRLGGRQGTIRPLLGPILMTALLWSARAGDGSHPAQRPAESLGSGPGSR